MEGWIALRSETNRFAGDADAIVVDRLTKRFGDVAAVAGLSFAVAFGAVTGFLGPNGAGKSTTLRAILGLVRPTSGSATVLGRRYAELQAPATMVGALLEASEFHPGRSGRDHLVYLARAARLPLRRVDEVLAAVELSYAARRRVGGYSLGMRQRLGLAGALLGEPEVLILDEPANGLDPAGVRWLRDFLRDFASSGRTVLVSSHVLAEVAQTVDDVVVIHRGRLVTHLPLAELTAQAQTVRVRTPDPDCLIPALGRSRLDVQRSNGALLVSGADAEQVGRLAFAAGVPLFELTPVASTLEEVFLELTAEQRR